MGPNGLPGPPGVKVSSRHLSVLPVTACILKFFCLLLAQPKSYKVCFSQGNQGEPGVGVQVKQLQ